MNIAEARQAAEALSKVAEAIDGVQDLTKVIKLERAIERAAGEAAKRAKVAVAASAWVRPDELDDWARTAGHNKIVVTLRYASVKLKWRADIAERPDDLKDLLADRMERGMAYMPRALLKSLYELGADVLLIREGEKGSKDVQDLAKRTLDMAAAWAARVEEARDAEADVIVCVAPF